MKQIKTTLLIAIIALGFTQLTQAQKVAHINMEELIASMPESATAKADMEKLGKSYETEIKTASTNLKTKYDKYTAEEKTVTPEINQIRASEVQQEQARLQQLQQAASQELQRKEIELLEPIYAKAKETIKAYAKENGIKYVLDARTLIYAEGEDISGAVKTKLGIQ